MLSNPLPRRPAGGDELPRMSLLQHLEELRKRLVWSLVALAGGVAACLGYAPEICRFLARPIYKYLPAGTKLTFLGVTDPFILYFKTSMIIGSFLACPFVLWQVWRFVSPGLYARERRWAGPFVFFGWFFFVMGGLFAYYVAFPFTVQFLLEMGQEFTPMITADRYYGFLLTILLGLGLMFELPILIVLLSAIGLVTPSFLIRQFRWAVLIIFTAAAIITPTSDVVNLCIFAVPTVGLYLLGVGAAALVTRAKRKRVAEAAGASAS